MKSKQLDHHANQLNPNSSAHRQMSNNRSNQGNPTSQVYYQGRVKNTGSGVGNGTKKSK